VGEHDHGLYAMPSLVDEQTLTISPSSTGPLLLEGPRNFQIPSEINIEVIGGNDELNMDPLGIPLYADVPKDKSSVLLFGKLTYYFRFRIQTNSAFLTVLLPSASMCL
jgi:hypothetical protein